MAWEVQADVITKARCREPEVDLSFARIVENSLDPDSPGEIDARYTYSSKSVLIVKTARTSPKTWQEDFSAK